jgi:hypothetical protein
MLDLFKSRHAEKRLNQRGIRSHDVDLLLNSATRVAQDAYLLTNGDVEREIVRRKKEIQQLERLRGLKLVVEGDILVTAYRSKKADQRRTLRKGREYK